MNSTDEHTADMACSLFDIGVEAFQAGQLQEVCRKEGEGLCTCRGVCVCAVVKAYLSVEPNTAHTSSPSHLGSQ